VGTVYPHNAANFTQGLVWDSQRQTLWESTGFFGESALVESTLEGSQELRRRPLDASLFGEGAAIVGDTILQLTWMSGECFVIERASDSLSLLQTFSFDGEGWGLAHDVARSRLIMSDGSSTLVIRDPETFALIAQVQVLDENQQPVDALNELEWDVVGNTLLANVWLSNRIARINLDTGRVIQWLDASALVAVDPASSVNGGEPDNVLNGIAQVDGGGDLLLTGKRWQSIYRVPLPPLP